MGEKMKITRSYVPQQRLTVGLDILARRVKLTCHTLGVMVVLKNSLRPVPPGTPRYVDNRFTELPDEYGIGSNEEMVI
jgi:hypothetical protein